MRLFGKEDHLPAVLLLECMDHLHSFALAFLV
jgi:hypothetical protein